MTSHLDANGAQFAWDSVSLRLANQCPQLYKYEILDGWTSRKENFHLKFGIWYARALEQYHKLRGDGLNFDDAERTIVRRVLEWTWIDGKPWDSGDTNKNRNNLIRSVIWYLEEYGDDDSMTTITLPSGKVAVEQSFRFELSDDLLYCGHMDRLVEFQGGTYVQDQKTTKNAIDDKYFKSYLNDVQVSGYIYAGKIVYDLPVKGMMIDVVQVGAGYSRYGRGFVTRTEPSLEEWREETIDLIHDIRGMVKSGKWRKNREACNNYFGCKFREICSRSPVVRDQFLKGDFDRLAPQDRWNPLIER